MEIKNILKVLDEALASKEFLINHYCEENQKLKADNENLKALLIDATKSDPKQDENW